DHVAAGVREKVHLVGLDDLVWRTRGKSRFGLTEALPEAPPLPARNDHRHVSTTLQVPAASAYAARLHGPATQPAPSVEPEETVDDQEACDEHARHGARRRSCCHRPVPKLRQPRLSLAGVSGVVDE